MVSRVSAGTGHRSCCGIGGEHVRCTSPAPEAQNTARFFSPCSEPSLRRKEMHRGRHVLWLEAAGGNRVARAGGGPPSPEILDAGTVRR